MTCAPRVVSGVVGFVRHFRSGSFFLLLLLVSICREAGSLRQLRTHEWSDPDDGPTSLSAVVQLGSPL